MKDYVLTFLFTSDLNRVWMIWKNKPDWQKGCLNGIGGKVEEGEDYIDAAIRELKEESGIELTSLDLKRIGSMEGNNNNDSKFKVVFFAGITKKILCSETDEVVTLLHIEDIKKLRHIENVPLLIEACLYALTGNSHFSEIIMKY